jgi:acetyltransferase-like isoleucine patch superfamily enzyme
VHPEKTRPPMDDPLELLPRALSKLYTIWVGRTYPFASIGRKVSFHFTSKVCRSRSPRIRIGNSVCLTEYAWLNVATEDPTGDPTIIVDDNCHIGFGSIISAKNRIHLERNVLIGQMVLMLDHNHMYEDISAPVVDQGITEGGTIQVGAQTWIGHGACIICSRGELTIGRNCVVAANSMVTRSIPDYTVVFGNPARIVRQYDPTSGVWVMGARSGAHSSSEPSPANA